jgi:Ice-binding-like
MKILSLSCVGNMFTKVIPVHRFRAKALFSLNFERVSGRAPAGCYPTLEVLEDRSMPSLIASQILPLVFPRATVNTVTVLAPALSASSPTPQQITLTDTISGAPTGGTVNFTIGAFHLADNVPVVNGVAQITIPIPVGTPAGTVTATFSGTPGFTGSTSSGAGNGTLTFCAPNASTLLGTTLQSFAVLAGSTVTNTGPTVIVGNVGVSPGLAVTGFPPGIVLAPSTIHNGDAVAALAQVQLTAAYTTILGEVGGFINLTGQDLGGLTLTPGRYHFDSSAQLTGTLILNNQNDPTARYDFQIGSTLTTASGSRVVFINGGADNVYWQVGSSATLGTSTVFAGNILANTSITLNTTASIACGRALARSGAVTLDTNFIDPAPQGPTVVVPATVAISKSPAVTRAAPQAPTVVAPPIASANLVTGTTTRLSVKGSGSTGAASLRYTWSTVSAPPALAPPTFSANGTNDAQSTTVTFHTAGTYTFRVTITDKNALSTTSDVTVMVKQSLTRIQVTPTMDTVHRNQPDPLAARAFDQFGAALLIQPIFSWSMASGIGSVSSTGLYRAPDRLLGTALIRASSGQVSGTASVTVLS